MYSFHSLQVEHKLNQSAQKLQTLVENLPVPPLLHAAKADVKGGPISAVLLALPP